MSVSSDGAAAGIAARIREAGGPLAIIGAGTRAGFGEPVESEALEVGGLGGVIAYEPTELYVRVGAGMTLGRLRGMLAEHGQETAGDLAGAPEATVGGAIAAGIDGPLRPGRGRLRDHLLGCRLIDGSGRELAFGGDLIKNVAGFDLTRLQAGALGTLGVLTEVSLRVSGRPEASATMARECSAHDAVELANEAVARGRPVDASAWHDGLLRIRVSGSAEAVERARDLVDGAELGEAEGSLWQPLRELRWGPLAGGGPIWMCRVPPLTELPFDDQGLIEWHGQRRWFFGDAPEDLRETVAAAGGSAVLYRRGEGQEGIPVFPEPEPGMLELSRRIKAVFDPGGILNPGRRSHI